jgi:hypothetical protein
VGHGTGQAVVAFAGRLALAVEHLQGEQERAAVDPRLLQVLAERHDGLVHDPDPSPLRPGRPSGGGIDEHRRRTDGQQPLQPTLAKDMIGGDQHEQQLASHLALDSGQRRAVAIGPPVGIHDPDPVAPNQSGVVADHHQDPLQPGGEQGPHRPLDQAQPPQPEQRLGATPGDRCQPLRLARGQHHPHPRQPRPRRIGLNHLRPTGERGQRISRELRCFSHAPTPLWQQGERRGTVQGSPVTVAQARPTRTGQPATGTTPLQARPG